jgi:hypothetical protein
MSSYDEVDVMSLLRALQAEVKTMREKAAGTREEREIRKAVKLEKFSGDQDERGWEMWWAHFDRVRLSNRWTDETAIVELTLSMRGQAEAWMQGLPEEEMSLEQWKLTMQSRFCSPKYEKMLEAKLTGQGEKESLEDYISRFRGVAKKLSAKRMTDDRKAERFRDGLRGWVGVQVRLSAKDDESLADSVLLAEKVHLASDPASQSEGAATPAGLPQWKDKGKDAKEAKGPGLGAGKDVGSKPAARNTAQSSIDALTRQMAQLALRMDVGARKQEGAGGSAGLRCYRCKCLGHIQFNCPFASAEAAEQYYMDVEEQAYMAKRGREDDDHGRHRQYATARRSSPPVLSIPGRDRGAGSGGEQRRGGNGGQQGAARGGREDPAGNQGKRVLQGGGRDLRPIGITEGEAPYSIEKVLKETLAGISFSQLLQLSPKLRTAVRRGLQTTKQGDEEAQLFELLGEDAAEINADVDQYIAEEPPLEEQAFATRGAPRAEGVLTESGPKPVIIDGGAYSNIISAAIAEAEGMSLKPCEGVRLIMADGRRVAPAGRVENLEVAFGEYVVYIDALVLAEPDYDVLLGRKFLMDLAVTTDWAANEFTMHDDRWGPVVMPMWTELTVEQAEETMVVREHVEFPGACVLPHVVPEELDGGRTAVGFIEWMEAQGVESTERAAQAKEEKLGNEAAEEDVWDKFVARLEESAWEVDGTMIMRAAMGQDVMEGLAAMEEVGETEEAMRTGEAVDEMRDEEWERRFNEAVEEAVARMPDGLRDDHQVGFRKLVGEFVDIFALDVDDIREPADLPPLKISLKPEAKPIRKRPYRLAPRLVKGMQEFVGKLLRNGLVRPSRGEWGFQMFGVPKPSGTGTRWVVDYRPLNLVSEADNYPLPIMDDIRDRMGGCEVFSALDFMTGFHQCPVDPESVPYLSFVTPFGRYEYLVAPMGPSSVPSHFQRAVDMTFEDMREFVEVFVDDLTVYTRKADDHLGQLRRIFERCREKKLKVGLTKCQFFREELRVLGMKIDRAGVSVDDRIHGKLEKMERPKSSEEVRRYLGLVGYHRGHIEAYASLSYHLTALLSKSKDFVWTENEEFEFMWLRELLLRGAFLYYPDFERKFIVRTDASGYAVGATLSQYGTDGKERVVRYYSRKLRKHEVNYTAMDLECLAVVEALKHFRHYLIGQVFDLFTDNRAVRELLNKGDWTGRLARWVVSIQEYSFRIFHKKGTENVEADLLSRMRVEGDEELMRIGEVVGFEEDLVFGLETTTIIGVLRGDDLTGVSDKTVVRARRLAKGFVWKDGTLWKRTCDGWREYVPKSKRRAVLAERHDGRGHFGIEATFKALKERYWWPGYFVDVKNWVRMCDRCRRERGSEEHKHAVRGVQVEEIFERWGLDFIGPLGPTKRGNRWILTATEHLSRWAEAVALPDANEEEVARFVYERIICRFGAPKYIQTDRGQNFRSEFVQKLSAIMRIKHKYSSIYNPQCNGMVEHFNGVLWTQLRKVSEDIRDWDLHLEMCLANYRRKPLAGHDFSPFQVVYGMECSDGLEDDSMLRKGRRAMTRIDQLAELKKDRKEIVAQKKLEQEARLIKSLERVKGEETEFVVEELVDVINLRQGADVGKYGKKWFGPFPIVEKGTTGAYLVLLDINERGRIERWINGRFLRKHYCPRWFRLGAEAQAERLEFRGCHAFSRGSMCCDSGVFSDSVAHGVFDELENDREEHVLYGDSSSTNETATPTV